MQGGDISNQTPKRFLFVFEGLIGSMPNPALRAREATYCKMHRWKRAVQCWVLDEHMVAHLWDIVWRWDYRFDVVTFKPEPFADALRDRLDLENVPVSNVHATSPPDLARRLSRTPDVARVFDPDPSRMFTYGTRGQIVTDPRRFQWWL